MLMAPRSCSTSSAAMVSARMRLSAYHLQVYFTAWALDILIPTLLSVLAALIVCPQVRPLLFPPRAPADNDSGSGQGAAGDTGSPNDITDPEMHKGERAEQEASTLVDSITNIAIESSSGDYGQSSIEDIPDSLSEPDPAETGADMPTENGSEKVKNNKKKKASHVTNQAMRVLSDITDAYERFSK